MIRMRMFFLVGALFLSGPAFADRARVVASFSVLADMVDSVAGEWVEVTALVRANSDLHSYRLRPQDQVLIDGAAAVFAIGLGFDDFVIRLHAAGRSQAKLRVVAPAVSKLVKHHGGPVMDPHLWHDPRLGQAMVDQIADTLSLLLPEHRIAIAARAKAYREEIGFLYQEFHARFATLPDQQRSMVVAHQGMAHFAHAYGLHLHSTNDGDGHDHSSANELAALIDAVREEPGAALFPENVGDQRLILQLAADTGAPVGGRLFTDALSNPEQGAPSYLKMLRHNAQTVWNALSQR